MFILILISLGLVSAQAPVYLQAAAPAYPYQYQYLYPQVQQQPQQYYQAAPASTCVQQCMPTCTPQCLTPQRDEELPTPPPEVLPSIETTTAQVITTTSQPDTIPCKCLIKITVTQGSSTYTRCSADSCTCPTGYNKCNSNCCKI